MKTSKVLIIVLVVLAVAIVALGAFLALSGAAMGEIGGFGPGHMDGYRGFAHGAPGFGRGHFGLPWLPIALFILLLGLLTRARRGRHHFAKTGMGKGHWHEGGQAEDRSALEILRAEFAEGRVSMEDFVARRKVLEEDGADRSQGGDA
ncbi:MAG: hypothetical protein WCL50_06165 [Spirochaetota bacterium]